MTQNIVITGASSGLGAALAEHYAAAGVTLGLLGRDAVRLQKVADSCMQRGAAVRVGVVDVADAAAMAGWLKDFDAEAPVDLLIANAGVSAGTAGGAGESESQVRQLFSVNIDGVLNSIFPLVDAMVARKSGQIAIMSSMASFRGLPSAPAYSASKAAVRVYGEGLRGQLARHNVGVTVVCPGYIKTPMTDVNQFPMPFLMSASKAAAKIAYGLAKNRSRLSFPLPMVALMWLISALPVAVTDPIFARLPGKPAAD